MECYTYFHSKWNAGDKHSTTLRLTLFALAPPLGLTGRVGLEKWPVRVAAAHVRRGSMATLANNGVTYHADFTMATRRRRGDTLQR